MNSINSKKSLANFLNPFSKTKFFTTGFFLAILLTGLWSSAEGEGEAFVCKKEIPKITYKNLSPPYKNYSYFRHRQVFPFQYKSSSFSLVNAWWLAEASTLVYSDDEYVRQRFSRAGLKRVKFFNRSSTQCFIAADNRFAIVAFRGSEIWKRGEYFDPHRIFSDLKTNIDIRLSEWIQGGKVHSGFKAALEDVWDELLPEIENLQAQGIKIWITGHSLGAALATLAADRLKTAHGLYTFGSPRVGDQKFKARFRAKAFRIVNGNDIVTRVPPAGFFRHVGELKVTHPIDGSHDQIETFETSKDASCTGTSNASDRAQEDGNFGLADLVPGAIRDHVPLLYSILLWNELVESLGSNIHR